MNFAVSNLKKHLAEKNLGGFIVTNPVNIFYLTGFKGISLIEREAILILTPNPTLITARLYQAEAEKLKSKHLKIKIVDERNQIHEFITESFSVIRGETPKIGFEASDLKFSEFKEYKKLLKSVKFLPCKNLVEDLRVIKSADEIRKIEKAQKISQKAFSEVLKTIKAGQTELEIAERLNKIIKSLGAQGVAFETIVASGPNSAFPHHVTGKRKVKKNEPLLFDFGAKIQNYCADCSRTIFLSKAKDEHKNIYDHVQKAQDKSINEIIPNLPTSKAFQTANDYFKANKLEKYFLHSLGHGIGLEVHERPPLGKKNNEKLAKGMVFSIEPGLYFPAWGGVRIEDLVTFKNGKAKILGTQAKFIEI